MSADINQMQLLVLQLLNAWEEREIRCNNDPHRLEDSEFVWGKWIEDVQEAWKNR